MISNEKLEKLAASGDFWDGRFRVVRELAARVLNAEGALRDIAAPLSCGCSDAWHGCGNDSPVVEGLQEIAKLALSNRLPKERP